MKLRNLTILVTGGAGFIGSHVSVELARRNRVIVYDNFSSSVRKPHELRKSNVRVIDGDILDQKRLEEAMRGVDVVFHLAVACLRISLSDPKTVHTINSTGTLLTLAAAKKCRIRRFIYVSSSEIYGDAQTSRMSEDHPKNPTTVYGMSKLHGELYTKLFSQYEGLPGIIVRPFNTYGPYSHFDGVYGEVIPRFVIRALSGMQPIIFGNGGQTRDFTYIADTVTGIIRAGEEDALLGTAVNIACGSEIAVGQLAKMICTLVGIDYQPILKPARPNDVGRHAADISLATRLLSFTPRVPVKDGLKRYIHWVQQNIPDPKKMVRSVPDINW